MTRVGSEALAEPGTTPAKADPAQRRAPAGEALATGVTVFLAVLLLATVIKVCDAVLLVRSLSGSASWPLSVPFMLPLLLGEELWVAALVGAAAGGLTRLVGRRTAGCALAALYLVYLALDQLGYKLFFSHLTVALFREEHDFPALWSSIRASVDAIFVGLALLAAGLAVLVGLGPRRLVTLDLLRRGLLARRRVLLPAALAYVGEASQKVDGIADEFSAAVRAWPTHASSSCVPSLKKVKKASTRGT